MSRTKETIKTTALVVGVGLMGGLAVDQMIEAISSRPGQSAPELPHCRAKNPESWTHPDSTLPLEHYADLLDVNEKRMEAGKIGFAVCSKVLPSGTEVRILGRGIGSPCINLENGPSFPETK